MTRRVVSFLLTIDGCPYAAGSNGCPSSVTSTDTDYPSGVVVLPGALDSSKLRSLSWSESIKPVTGETTVDSITLALVDERVASGPATGERPWSWLFSRRSRAILRAPLATSIDDTASSIVVSSDPGLSTGAQTIWIDREAIRCSSYNAGTKTFTVAASGRGYLGTRAAYHAIDAANAFTPVVWTSFPNPQRRRAILWLVEGGVATPLWRGYLGRAPRLSSDNATWELQLDHAITVQSARRLGPSQSLVHIVGFQPESFDVTLLQTGFAGATVNVFSVMREPYLGTWPESADACLSILLTALNAQLALVSVPISAAVTGTVTDGRMRVESVADVRHTLNFGARGLRDPSLHPPFVPVAGEPYDAVEISASTFQGIRTLPYSARAHCVLRNGVPSPVTISTTAGIPGSVAETTHTDGAVSTTVGWALSGEDSAGFVFHLALASVDHSTRRVVGTLRRTAVSFRRGISVEIRGDILVTEPTSVQLVTRVESSHWVRALEHGVFATGYGIDEQADPRDWSWATADEVVGATGGEYSSSRVWVFDGSATVGDYVKDACKLDGCAVGIRGSRLAFVPLSPPLDTDETDFSITLASDGIHRALPTYTTLPEGVVNSVVLQREPSVTVNNQTSIALYGLAPALELDVKGALAESTNDLTPFELARGPLSRLLGLWGEPSELVTVDASLDALDTAELGKIVSITSKTLPDGLGHRGTSSTRRGRVISRAIDLGRGVVRLSVLVFPHRVSGYAPAARVASVSGFTITLDVNYLTSSSTATDYAGSNQGDYLGTANDGGTSRFQAGDILRFRVIDSTSPVEEGGFEVASVNPATKQITFTTQPSAGSYDWSTYVAPGTTVDIVTDEYSAATARQQGYAFVGSRSARDLGGDDLKEWAP